MLAIIGGSGLYQFADDALPGQKQPQSTVWGETSAPLERARIGNREVLFLARHGLQHQFPPHRINYRANIQALADAGVTQIIAVNAVGAINDQMPPGSLVIPDQLIDYTWDRPHTFHDRFDSVMSHIDFTWPFAGRAREALLNCTSAAGVPVAGEGCYACMQGPRLESAAEIGKLARDGNDLVGMTAMPEAALAREKGIEYASVCMVANRAAGLSGEPLSLDDIKQVLTTTTAAARALIRKSVTCL